MAALGIDVVLPPRAYLQSELPVLTPLAAGLIRRPGELAILDAGGNNVGARVLAALGDAFAGRSCRVLQVVNPYRPETATREGCERIRRSIEAAARLPVTDWVGNANPIDETTPGAIVEGYAFITWLAAARGLPRAFVTAPAALLADVDTGAFDCPVLAIRGRLGPPWTEADAVGQCSGDRNTSRA